MNDIVWQAIRYSLIAVGTWMAARNYIPVTEVAHLADNIVSFLSLGVSIVSAAWGFYIAWKTKRVPLTTAQRPDVPTINPATGAIQPPTVVHS
jgi:hypothetical protein